MEFHKKEEVETHYYWKEGIKIIIITRLYDCLPSW